MKKIELGYNITTDPLALNKESQRI